MRDDPQPIYVGDEYAAPLIGDDELDRHWARVAGRLKAASVSSTLHEFDVVDDTVVRALLLSRWRLTGREADVERTGTSWITWLLVRRGERYRIFHQMESQVYLTRLSGCALARRSDLERHHRCARRRPARDRVQPDLGQVDGRVDGVQPCHRLGDVGGTDRIHLERHVLAACRSRPVPA